MIYGSFSATGEPDEFLPAIYMQGNGALPDKKKSTILKKFSVSYDKAFYTDTPSPNPLWKYYQWS